MKQILFLLLLIPFFSFSNKLEISTLTLNDDGNFITYSVAKGESLGDIAKKFSIKTATLLKYNNLLLNSSLKPNQSISIPLTETNYFRLNGITNSDSFLPIYYILESNIEKNILCTQLRILVESFDKWNKTEYADHLITGEKVLVGWLKIGTISQEESLPNKISRKEITNNNVKFEDHKMHPTYETPSKIVNSDNKIIDKKFNEPIQKREHEVVSSLNPKAIKKLNDRLSGSIKKIYQSIFTYNVDLKKAKKPIINSVKVKEIVVEEIFKESIDSNFTIKNEIKSSHLANSKNGKASLFYAGNKSGKIYIVTNLAPKGDIVKVTNTSNGQYVMAVVISSLPNADISKGLLIKLSENAKFPLGVTDNVFIVKVNY